MWWALRSWTRAGLVDVAVDIASGRNCTCARSYSEQQRMSRLAILGSVNFRFAPASDCE